MRTLAYFLTCMGICLFGGGALEFGARLIEDGYRLAGILMIGFGFSVIKFGLDLFSELLKQRRLNRW